MERKPRVYLINNKEYDLSGAVIHGDLVLLYDDHPKDVFFTSKHAFYLKGKLEDMQSSDYLICAGNMIMLLIAFGIIYEKFGFVNLLLFDVRTSQYTARVIPRHQLQGGKNG